MDSSNWQVPIISLTAQSFLFIVELGSTSTRYERTAACALGVLISFASIQLLARFRKADFIDSDFLGKQEARAGFKRMHGVSWNERGWPPKSRIDALTAGLGHIGAYKMWRFTLATFGLASLLTLVITWTAPNWLHGPDSPHFENVGSSSPYP